MRIVNASGCSWGFLESQYTIMQKKLSKTWKTEHCTKLVVENTIYSSFCIRTFTRVLTLHFDGKALAHYNAADFHHKHNSSTLGHPTTRCCPDYLKKSCHAKE